MAEQQYLNFVHTYPDAAFPYLVLGRFGSVVAPRSTPLRIMHWHDDLQLVYAIDGPVRIKTLSEDVTLAPGEGAYINKGVVHLLDTRDACQRCSFVFPARFLSFYEGGPAEALTRGIVEGSQVQLVVLRARPGWEGEVLHQLAELVELESRKDDALYSYEVLCRLTRIWLALLRHMSVPQARPENATDRRVRSCLLYIQQHYAEDVTLDDLAAAAGVSRSECLRCFKATLQTTPYRYLVDFRLSQAITLLERTDEPIGRIAACVGFHQQSHFGRCFKERMGCTPGQYRKQLGQDA